MEHLAAVTARMAEIRERFPAPAAPQAFERALTAAMGQGQPGAPAAAGAMQLSARGALSPQHVVRPVDGPLTSGFGMRLHPVHGREAHHAGVDFGAPQGTPIRAASGGTVTFAGPRGGYGNLVIIDHGDGLETYYAHQRETRVREGDRVGTGQVLGTVGMTGTATGPHLHFEVRRDSEPVDPLPWLGAVSGGLSGQSRGLSRG